MDGLNILPNFEETASFTSSIKFVNMKENKITPLSDNILSYSPSKMKVFYEDYTIKRTIYENVLTGWDILLLEDKNNIKYAGKQIKKNKLKNIDLHQSTTNVFALQFSLSRLSKNIVEVKDYYEDDESYIMIMEYSCDANFFEDQLENKCSGINDENLLRLYAYDILSAIKILHDNGVIHCDIKPSNFLIFQGDIEEDVYDETENYTSDYDIGKIKLTNFTLSHLINCNNLAYIKYSTRSHEYKAPEVKDECYVDKSIDLWSFGISLYQIAVAYFPTNIKNYKYGSGSIPFRYHDWKEYKGRKLLQDLICKCLQYNPEERITVDEALKHPWFNA